MVGEGPRLRGGSGDQGNLKVSVANTA
jgi:hypothetical protein